MRNVLMVLTQLKNDEDGAALIEYTALQAILLVAGIATAGLVGTSIAGKWTELLAALGAADFVGETIVPPRVAGSAAEAAIVPPRVGGIVAGSAAEASGLAPGDLTKSVDRRSVAAVANFVSLRPGQAITLGRNHWVVSHPEAGIGPSKSGRPARLSVPKGRLYEAHELQALRPCLSAQGKSGLVRGKRLARTAEAIKANLEV
jgi:pilus assembly protein Flp/PilA